MTDIKRINDWLQVVGMFGLIASLVFVGLQIKQDREIALSATYQARSDATVESSIAAMNSTVFLDAMAKVYANRSDEMTMQEAIALENYIGATMTMFENNHQQYLLGYLSEEHWQRNVREMRCMFENPVNREIVAGWQFRDSFRQLTDELTEEAIRNPAGCWAFTWTYPVAE